MAFQAARAKSWRPETTQNVWETTNYLASEVCMKERGLVRDKPAAKEWGLSFYAVHSLVSI